MRMKLKGLIKPFISILAVSAIVTVYYVVTKGVPLYPAPEIDRVEKVVVTSTEFPGETREYTDGEKIEMAVKLMNFLNYKLFASAPDSDKEPVISIRYLLSDGKEMEVKANSEAVWYRGNVFELKKKEEFVKLAGVLFFPQESFAGGGQETVN